MRCLNITGHGANLGNVVPFMSGHAPLTSLAVTSAAYLSRSLIRYSPPVKVVVGPFYFESMRTSSFRFS